MNTPTQPSTQKILTDLDLSERWVGINFALRLNSRYHSERRRFFQSLHTAVAALSAVFGSATVTLLLTDVVPNGQLVAIGFALIITVMSAIDSVVGFSAKASEYQKLAVQYIDLERDFLKVPMTEDSYIDVLCRKRALEATEPPTVIALSNRVSYEIRLSDGYDGEDLGERPGWFSWRFANVLR